MIDEKVASLHLSKAQKRALFKLAVDLIKIDNRIHKNEITFLDELQGICCMPPSELELIHYISLQQAVTLLKRMEHEAIEVIIGLLEKAMCVDNDIDFKENLLLSAVKMALRSQSGDWCHIISCADINVDCSDRQIVYLEKSECSAAHYVLDDKYDNLLITKLLNDIGFQLFYLPGVIKDFYDERECQVWEESKYRLLQRSMEFLVPIGEPARIGHLKSHLLQLSTSTFFNLICARFKLDRDAIPAESFLMVKIQDGYVIDDDRQMKKTDDFLCIDIAEHVKERILSFVSMIEKPSFTLSYDGYYRMLYDYLSTEAPMMSTVVLDAKFDFMLSDIGGVRVKFESAPQAKTLYLLLLFYGRHGVEQSTFHSALNVLQSLNRDIEEKGVDSFDMANYKSILRDKGDDASVLIYNTMTIYETISTKDAHSPHYLNYIVKILQYRSMLKNYVNNGFQEIQRLANKDRYCISFNSDTKAYYLPIGPSSFFVKDYNNSDCLKALSEHALWKSLL